MVRVILHGIQENHLLGGGGGGGLLSSHHNFFGALFLDFLDPPLNSVWVL